MPLPALYVLSVLIWGATWIGIHVQVQSVSPDEAVLYRFALAAVCGAVIVAGLRKSLRVPACLHGWLALQGLLLNSLNFLFIYRGAQTLPSGLIAVVFSCAPILNALNERLFLGRPVSGRVVGAGMLGALGLTCLFWPEVRSGTADFAALGYVLAGTLCFSLGNLVGGKVRAGGADALASNVIAMSYGAAVLIAWTLASGVSYRIPADTAFWTATVYLAVFGSFVGFAAYLTLVRAWGAAAAGYVTVAAPVVAMTLSTLFEGYQWTGMAVLGVVLVGSGNVVMFAPPALRRRRRPA